MKIIIAFACMVLLSITSCTTMTIKLTLKNSEDYDVGVRVIEQDEDGTNSNVIKTDTIAKNEEKIITMESKKGKYLIVKSNIRDSATIYTSDPIFIPKRGKETSASIIIKNSGVGWDDKESYAKLVSSFGKIGNDIGAPPLDLKTALTSIIGAVVVAIPGEKDARGEIIYTIDPDSLKITKMKIDDIVFDDNNNENSVIITGEYAVNASINIPMIAKFGADFKKTSLYQMKWKISGFGQKYKIETTDPMEKIKLLSRTQREQIKNAQKNSPNSKIYYINAFYVVKNASLYIKEAKLLSYGIDTTATSVVSAQGVYTFDKTEEIIKTYSLQVLNFWGIPLTFDTVKASGYDGSVTVEILRPDGEQQELYIKKSSLYN